ncbi:MAG: hypothetical protein ABEH89_01255, partial [bacterium]
MKTLRYSLIALLSFALVVGLGAPNVGAKELQTTYEGPSGLSNAVTFGGYYEFEYEDVANSPGDFDQHRTILFFGAQPHERLRFFNELELEHGGHPDVKLEQSWLEFSLNENHNFRGGIDLIPVGRKNINHDGNLRDFVFRPYTADRLIPTTWFESGLSFNGEVSNVSYRIGMSNGLEPADSTGGRGEIASMVNSNLDERDQNGSKAVWGRVAFNPVLGTEIALSGYQSNYDTGTSRNNSIRFIALDFNSIQGPWEFTGEFVDVVKDQQTPGGLEGAGGGYVEAAYHFFPDALRDSFIASDFDNPTFTALARYETLGYDEQPPGAAELDETYTSIGFNYRPIERVAYKASYDIQ